MRGVGLAAGVLGGGGRTAARVAMGRPSWGVEGHAHGCNHTDGVRAGALRQATCTFYSPCARLSGKDRWVFDSTVVTMAAARHARGRQPRAPPPPPNEPDRASHLLHAMALHDRFVSNSTRFELV